MMPSTLRIAGPDWDVAAFLRANPELRPDATWRKGDAVRSGVRCSDSGLSLCLSQAQDWSSLTEETLAKLLGLEPILLSARQAGAALELSFGLEVGDDSKFSTTAVFGGRVLSKLAALDASLVVAAYAVSDE